MQMECYNGLPLASTDAWTTPIPLTSPGGAMNTSNLVRWRVCWARARMLNVELVVTDLGLHISLVALTHAHVDYNFVSLLSPVLMLHRGYSETVPWSYRSHSYSFCFVDIGNREWNCTFISPLSLVLTPFREYSRTDCTCVSPLSLVFILRRGYSFRAVYLSRRSHSCSSCFVNIGKSEWDCTPVPPLSLELILRREYRFRTVHLSCRSHPYSCCFVNIGPVGLYISLAALTRSHAEPWIQLVSRAVYLSRRSHRCSCWVVGVGLHICLAALAPAHPDCTFISPLSLVLILPCGYRLMTVPLSRRSHSLGLYLRLAALIRDLGLFVYFAALTRARAASWIQEDCTYVSPLTLVLMLRRGYRKSVGIHICLTALTRAHADCTFVSPLSLVLILFPGYSDKTVHLSRRSHSYSCCIEDLLVSRTVPSSRPLEMYLRLAALTSAHAASWTQSVSSAAHLSINLQFCQSYSPNSAATSDFEQNLSDIISSAITSTQILNLLTTHGCVDITSSIDLSSCSNNPVANGGLGDIFIGQLRTGTRVAIKVLRSYGESNELAGKYQKAGSTRAAREIHTWSKCQHPNVVELIGLTVFRECLAMVSEWEDNGNMTHYLSRNPTVNRCELVSQGIVTYPYASNVLTHDSKSKSICAGISYLHSMDIVSRMIPHPNNGATYLCERSYRPQRSSKIDRLWLCQIFERYTALHANYHRAKLLRQMDSKLSPNIFPSLCQFISPHHRPRRYYEGRLVIQRKGIYMRSEWYSAFTTEVPFSGRSEISLYRHIVDRKKTPSRPGSIIPERSVLGNVLWALLMSCWSYNPAGRPTAQYGQVLPLSDELLKEIAQEPDDEDEDD
ncbi:protein tyrosine kinase domain-containing protein [Rhizoctonia solani AG-1 IA]|uniref:Protein tyrosine kinase domain-containing protein n=1 Tax=Thanatephorus cucumeris (strain AG1-IA) TaxID=983506 RepID=L8X079_THACA|nr:protein tyrosine kinase domain-containing protein [Rhizoctonia solani AG-1 IA]